jgi:hypothetical protein
MTTRANVLYMAVEGRSGSGCQKAYVHDWPADNFCRPALACAEAFALARLGYPRYWDTVLSYGLAPFAAQL